MAPEASGTSQQYLAYYYKFDWGYYSYYYEYYYVIGRKLLQSKLLHLLHLNYLLPTLPSDDPFRSWMLCHRPILDLRKPSIIWINFQIFLPKRQNCKPRIWQNLVIWEFRLYIHHIWVRWVRECVPVSCKPLLDTSIIDVTCKDSENRHLWAAHMQQICKTFVLSHMGIHCGANIHTIWECFQQIT